VLPAVGDFELWRDAKPARVLGDDLDLPARDVEVIEVGSELLQEVVLDSGCDVAAALLAADLTGVIDLGWSGDEEDLCCVDSNTRHGPEVAPDGVWADRRVAAAAVDVIDDVGKTFDEPEAHLVRGGLFDGGQLLGI